MPLKPPRHERLANREQTTLAHNADPNDAVAKCRKPDNRRHPTQRKYSDDNSRNADGKPGRGEQSADDPDCTWRLMTRRHELPMPN
jgi:hypothetical protein